jgi:protease-4
MSNRIDNPDMLISQELVSQLLREQRSAKRWKNIRFVAWFILIATILGVIVVENKSSVTTGLDSGKGYAALIRLNGMIAPGSDFSAEKVLPVLKEAFTDTDAKGVVLVIDSGGGTPVQASIIHDAILQLKKKYHKPVIVVGEDVLASGAYYVAVSADKIYVNQNTITGSIGVIMKGFGFNELIKKIGIERRVFASGVNKDRLDPFLPQTKEDEEKIRSVISEIHDNFNQVVLKGRQGKLHAEPAVLFSGDFWSGQTALKLGLVDGLGNVLDVLQNEFKVSQYKDYSADAGVMKTLMGQFGMAMNMLLNNNRLHLMAQI